MNIIISHTSMEPIYEQIVRQIRAKIIDGSLKEKRTTSIRPDTVKRAEDQCAYSKKRPMIFWMRKE